MYDREETIGKALLTAEEADLNAKWEKVFLNTKSNADDIPAELRIILDYFDGRTEGKPTDPLLIRIQDAVARAKMNTEWRREYMLWQHELAHEKRLAREAGWEEGREEGRQQGREEGRQQGREEGQGIMNRLIACLLQDGRLDELRQSSADPAFQNELLKEYHLI